MTYENSSKKHRVVGSFTTNTNDPATASWNLAPYQTTGIGKPGGRWRLIEVGYNLLYAEGEIASDGTLAGLSSPFYSHYSYDGYMELQVFDPEPKCTTCPCPEDEKEEKCKCQ